MSKNISQPDAQTSPRHASTKQVQRSPIYHHKICISSMYRTCIIQCTKLVPYHVSIMYINHVHQYMYHVPNCASIMHQNMYHSMYQPCISIHIPCTKPCINHAPTPIPYHVPYHASKPYHTINHVP
jgi:hypothetical protein